MKILNFGSINKDFFYSVNDFVRPGETISSNRYDIKIGGKGLNQSVGISKAGVKVYHAGIINKDDTFIIDKLKSWKINCDNILLSDNPTGHAIIQVNKKGENSIIIHGGANHDFNLKSIKSILSKFETGDILLLQNEINNIEEIIDRAHYKKMKIIFNPAPFNNDILKYDLNKINTLILNQSEGEGLSNEKIPDKILKVLNNNFKVIISIFAGRAADTGKDPLPEFKKSINLAKKFKNVEILWASVREPYNYLQAKQLGCHIITIPPVLIEKIEKFGKSFNELTIETVKAFLVDSKKSNFKI